MENGTGIDWLYSGERSPYQMSLEQAEEIYQGLQSWGFTSPEHQARIEATFLEYLRPKMEWKSQFSKEYGYVVYHCSNCGNDELVKTPFCPQCGAMETKDVGLE